VTNENPELEKNAEYAAFDVLRFLLASAVLLSHVGILPWAHAGNLAVQVFFALSGWLIGGILYDTSSKELSRFYFNRSTRVWIPYFFTVAALYLTSALHEPVRSPHWFRFLAYDLTFTHNWFSLWPDPNAALAQMPLQGTGNHFWSLAVEEQFYLVCPLVMTLSPYGRSMLTWLSATALVYFSGSQYGAIGMGVLAAVSARKYPGWHLDLRVTTAIAITMLASSIAMLREANYLYAAPVFAVCAILLCARPQRRGPFTKWLGGVSFPLYLNAWIGMFALHWFEKRFAMPPAWLLEPAEYFSGVVAGALTYQMIDKPTMKHRNRYFSPRLGWAMGAVAYLLVISGVGVWAAVVCSGAN
jgi:peptidoglycan/LPS O-acetylase OafA/YrhL